MEVNGNTFKYYIFLDVQKKSFLHNFLKRHIDIKARVYLQKRKKIGSNLELCSESVIFVCIHIMSNLEMVYDTPWERLEIIERSVGWVQKNIYGRQL